jgi:hypothetical protein
MPGIVKTPDWLLNIPKGLLKNRMGENKRAELPLGQGANNIMAANAPMRTQPGQSGFTGAGADGIVQPMNRAGPPVNPDEGEMVINAQDTQNIGQDLLQGLIKASRSGNLTPQASNTIREAVGVQPEVRMQEGTYVPTAGRDTRRRDVGGEGLPGEGDPQSTTTVIPETATRDTQRLGVGGEGIAGEIDPQSTAGETKRIASVSPAMPGGIGTEITDTTKTADTFEAFTGEFAPAPAEPTEPTKAPSIAEKYRDIAMGSLYDIMRGESPYFKTYANRLLQRQALRAAADEGAMRQELTQSGDLDTGFGQAKMADLLRRQRAEESELMGSLAESAQAKMDSAALQLSGEARAAISADRSQAWDTYNELIEAGNYVKAAEKFGEMTGISMDPTKLQENYERGIAGEDFLVLDEKFNKLLKDGMFPEAEELYNDMMANPLYAKWMTPFDFDKAKDTYNSEQVDGFKLDIANLIAENAPDWQIEPLIRDLFEMQGIDLDEKAEELGMTPDELVESEIARYRKEGATGFDKVLNQYTDAFEGMFDTDLESDTATMALKQMFNTPGVFELDIDGNYKISDDSVLLPWNNPRYAHVFDDRLSLNEGQVKADLDRQGLPSDPDSIAAEIENRQGTIDARENYVTAHKDDEDNPLYDSYENWNKVTDAYKESGTKLGFDEWIESDEGKKAIKDLGATTGKPIDTFFMDDIEYDVMSTDKMSFGTLEEIKSPTGETQYLLYDTTKGQTREGGTVLSTQDIADKIKSGGEWVANIDEVKGWMEGKDLWREEYGKLPELFDTNQIEADSKMPNNVEIVGADLGQNFKINNRDLKLVGKGKDPNGSQAYTIFVDEAGKVYLYTSMVPEGFQTGVYSAYADKFPNINWESVGYQEFGTFEAL